MQIKAANAAGPLTRLTATNVGVGEVFVVPGKSNSTNYGGVPQKTQTGMITSFNWVK